MNSLVQNYLARGQHHKLINTCRCKYVSYMYVHAYVKQELKLQSSLHRNNWPTHLILKVYLI